AEARVVLVKLGGVVDVDDARERDGLADVGALGLRELLGPLSDKVVRAVQDTRALPAGEARPHTRVERVTGGRDGGIDVGCRRYRDLGDLLSRGRIDDIHAAAVRRIPPPAADEQLSRRPVRNLSYVLSARHCLVSPSSRKPQVSGNRSPLTD